MTSPIEEIKNRLDIVEVIGSYIKLQKAGANYRALCPFHTEKTPSFFVSPSRQIWHCFGCSAGGDIFKFVMQVEGVEFGDALRILAQKAGVELKPKSSAWQKLKTERQKLYDISELASSFFQTQLEKSKKGQEVKKYLQKRGLSQESILKWRIGYAPDIWQGVSDFLVGRGYQREEVVKAGLAIKKEENSKFQIPDSRFQFYDRFRGRIIFPIFDLNSQVIGFGGRIFSVNQRTNQRESASTEAKYINTPNTLLYDKSKILYGLDKAKLEIRKKDACILVEGYMDCIMSHQAEVENVVAVSGTALTFWQLNLLKRYSQNLILSFDMDVAGSEATKRGIGLAQKEGFNIKVVKMPKDDDPADIILKGKEEEWQKIVDRAKPILEFYFNLAFLEKDPKNISDKKEIANTLLPVIKRIPNKIEQAYWLGELSQKLKVKEEDIETELKKVKEEGEFLNAPSPPKESPVLAKKTRKELLAEKILIFVLIDSKKIDLLNKKVIENFSSPVKEVLLKIKDNPKISQQALQKELRDSPKVPDFLNYIFLKSDLEKEEEKEEDIAIEFEVCLDQTEKIQLKESLNKLSSQIKEFENKGDSGKVKKLIQEFNNLSKKLS